MKNSIVVVFVLFFCSCTGSLGAGSLSAWEIRVFEVPEVKLIAGIDCFLQTNPKYSVIQKWKDMADGWEKAYSFMKTYVFYFDQSPSEMYYVTLIDAGYGNNPNYSRLAIRAVENGSGSFKQYEEFNAVEQERIRTRFYREVIVELEQIVHTKSYVEER